MFSVYHKNIRKHPERITKIKLFINQQKYREINYHAEMKDWKKFKNNNKTIALNVLFSPNGREEIRREYISKFKSCMKIK